MAGQALLLFAGGLAAGALNAVAGGGPIIAIGVLILGGLDARIANLTSTVALFPGQVMTGWHARRSLSVVGDGQGQAAALAISLIGGAIGAGLLLFTAPATFGAMVPWLVLFATLAYAASALRPPRGDGVVEVRPALGLPYALLAVYGGYYGGGNSFMVLALLAAAGLAPRSAGHLKNLLIAAINCAAVAVFALSGEVAWAAALPVLAGALAGSVIGVRLLDRVDPAILRALVIAGGLGMAGWLFSSGSG